MNLHKQCIVGTVPTARLSTRQGLSALQHGDKKRHLRSCLSLSCYWQMKFVKGKVLIRPYPSQDIYIYQFTVAWREETPSSLEISRQLMVSGERKDTCCSGTVTGNQPLILAPVINPTAAQLVIENDFKRCRWRTSWEEEGHSGMMRGHHGSMIKLHYAHLLKCHDTGHHYV